jgi:RNA polymerase sigma-70 factor (ECF subfamily)
MTNDASPQDLEMLYDLYFDKLYKFFYYKVLSKEVAEDLTSDTFITFAQIIKDKKQIENVKAFLFGVAKNIFLKYLQQKYRQPIPFSSISDNFEEYADNYVQEVEKKVNLEDKVMLFLNKVPEKQRIVLQLRLIEKLSLKEICIKLDKDMNYVKTTQKRGLKTLKEIIALSFGKNDRIGELKDLGF